MDRDRARTGYPGKDAGKAFNSSARVTTQDDVAWDVQGLHRSSLPAPAAGGIKELCVVSIQGAHIRSKRDYLESALYRLYKLPEPCIFVMED